MVITINSSKDFHQHFSAGRSVIAEDIVFNVNPEATFPTKPIYIKKMSFEGTVRLLNAWCGSFIFEDCKLTQFITAGDFHLEYLFFNKCSFKSIVLEGRPSLKSFTIRESKQSGLISVAQGVSIGYCDIYNNPRVRNIEVSGKIEVLRVVNKRQYSTTDKSTDRPLHYTSRQSIGSISLVSTQITDITLELVKTQALRIFGAHKEGLAWFNHIYAAHLVIQEFSSSNATFNRVDVDFQSTGELDIFSSDLNGVRFHDCRLGIPATIKSSRLEGAITLDTEWPLEVKGTGESKHRAYRQLRLMHEAQGSHRKQLDYSILEMSAFKASENQHLKDKRKQIKGLSDLGNWISSWFEHVIKVSLPDFTSRFGTRTGRAIFIFLVFWVLMTNALILFQGEELKIIYAWSWPWQWDWSLFFHIALPTHRGLYHGTVLLETIDIPWKIISAYLIYHIVVSSRKLVKN